MQCFQLMKVRDVDNNLFDTLGTLQSHLTLSKYCEKPLLKDRLELTGPGRKS
jgi:hypothetical protein